MFYDIYLCIFMKWNFYYSCYFAMLLPFNYEFEFLHIGYLQSRAVYFLMNIHITPRAIYLTRVSLVLLFKIIREI